MKSAVLSPEFSPKETAPELQGRSGNLAAQPKNKSTATRSGKQIPPRGKKLPDPNSGDEGKGR